jgi:hypothetical protein
MGKNGSFDAAKQKIHEVLSVYDGDKINICYLVYQEIVKCEEYSGKLLQFFYENAEGISSSKEKEAPVFFDEKEKDAYEDAYGKLADGIFEKLLKRRPTNDEFYVEFWKYICMDDLFEDEKAKVFAVYYIWIDRRIPYFELTDGIQIEGKEYKKCIEKLLPQLQKVRFILATEHETWSEVGDWLIQILDTVNEPEEKAVLMSCIMQTWNKIASENNDNE